MFVWMDLCLLGCSVLLTPPATAKFGWMRRPLGEWLDFTSLQTFEAHDRFDVLEGEHFRASLTPFEMSLQRLVLTHATRLPLALARIESATVPTEVRVGDLW